jgi:hypothetical protein
MKLIIAGGRGYNLSEEDKQRLDGIEGVTEVVSGTARGVDKDGELWAEARGIPVRRFAPDWRLGKAAGIQRNRDMAAYADAVALFPGSRGTESMYEIAKKKGLRIFDFRTVAAVGG